jgi:hypothetical protein
MLSGNYVVIDRVVALAPLGIHPPTAPTMSVLTVFSVAKTLWFSFARLCVLCGESV